MAQVDEIFLDLAAWICYNDSYWGGEMRKRISCRVIRSIPLGRSGDAHRHASRPDHKHSKISDTAALTYTDRLDGTKVSFDEASAAQILDLYV